MSQISKCPKVTVVLTYWEASGDVSELRYKSLLYCSSKRSYCRISYWGIKVSSRSSIILLFFFFSARLINSHYVWVLKWVRQEQSMNLIMISEHDAQTETSWLLVEHMCKGSGQCGIGGYCNVSYSIQSTPRQRLAGCLWNTCGGLTRQERIWSMNKVWSRNLLFHLVDVQQCLTDGWKGPGPDWILPGPGRIWAMLFSCTFSL